MWRIMGIGSTVFWVAVALAGYYAYLQLWSVTSSDSQLRHTMARQVCANAAQQLQLPHARSRIVVGRCHGDVDNIVTDELRLAIGRRNTVVVDVMPWDTFAPAFLWPAADLTLEENVHLAKSHAVPYLIFCQIEQWTIAPGEELILTIKLSLVDVEQVVVLQTDSFTYQPNGNAVADQIVTGRDNLAPRDSLNFQVSSNNSPISYGKLLAFATWLVVCLTVPWFGQEFITTALRSQSNLTGVGLILGYLFVVATTGWLTWADFDSKWLTATLLCGVALPWLSYFEFVCRSVAQRVDR